MREKRVWAVLSCVQSGSDGETKLLGVPVNDDGGQQVQSSHAVVLPFGRTVADFALAPDAQGVFQSVVGFAFVQADLGAALHVCIEQPVDDEERSLNAPDFSECQGQLMLTRI